MNIRKLSYLCMIAMSSFVMASCGNDEEHDYVLAGGSNGDASDSEYNTEASKVPAKYAHRMEVPALTDGDVFVEHSTLVEQDSVMTYCLSYCPEKYHSRWVAFRFDGNTRNKVTSRGDNFVDDPDLPSSLYIGSKGFGQSYTDLSGNIHKNGFDRGHLVASADRLYSTTANDQTFYMSNMSPQISGFNQKFWVAFESLVQNKGRDVSFSDTLYVVKGGTIADDQMLGHISRDTGASVVVPKYYFMALLKCKNNAYESIAFLMEHKDYGYTDSNQVTKSIIAQYAVSIDELESFTGIDFFPNLSDVVETAVEKTYTLSTWGL